jgi:hypothetical protein
MRPTGPARAQIEFSWLSLYSLPVFGLVETVPDTAA